MSRAFVKEDDGAPAPPPMERPVSSSPNKVTPRGLSLIASEIARLEAAIAGESNEDARAPLRRDLNYWSARSASAIVVEPDPDPAAAGFGVRVTIRRGGVQSEIEIVGEDEADPAEGRLAWTSPLARALDEAEAGDSVELEAGGRVETIDVLRIAPGGDA
jgi:transcription elongation GreA/GreB family factor